MTIKTTTTETVTKEIEIDTPCYWSHHHGQRFSAILSEEDTITVILQEGYTSICKCRYQTLYKPEEIFKGEEISQLEFNTALARAVIIVSGIEIVANETELVN